MQALLVGGPLHGTLTTLEDERALSVTGEDDAAEFSYIRRSSSAQFGSEVALFVYGRPTYEDVIDAVRRSSLSQTAKLRVLGPDDFNI
jgi:hypothetical protein